MPSHSVCVRAWHLRDRVQGCEHGLCVRSFLEILFREAVCLKRQWKDVTRP